jgi:enhancing lycopene biosynthesis protein 2
VIKAGILLSGCGFYDGTEVSEAVLAALSLERAGARVVHIAPDIDQMHTVDHLSGGEVAADRRRLAAEAARVARGRVTNVTQLAPGARGAWGTPGGLGVVKNLMSNFANLAAPRAILPEVRALLQDLAQRKAPIGSISLGRTLVQTFLDEPLAEEDMQLAATEVLIDEARRLAFTPGFLTGTSLSEVAVGIDRMVQALMKLSGPRTLNVIP